MNVYIIELIKIFFICIAATVFYSLLMKTPLKAVLISAFIGSFGYIINLIMQKNNYNMILSYFTGTLFIAFAGEILARIFKKPSTIFIIPAIIPLVPGYSLYQTMLLLVQNDMDGFIRTGAQTFFLAGSMAVSIALINFIARRIFPRKT